MGDPTAIATAAHETSEAAEDPPMSSGSGITKATTYRWMWGDAGEDTWGHELAEMNPFRWSLWADAADTIKNLEQYKKHDDQYRPVQLEVGPPPCKTQHFSNIAETVEYLNSYKPPGNSDPSDEEELSYRPEVAAKSYPPGVFQEFGGQIETKVAVGKIKVAAHPWGSRIHLADVAELFSIASLGCVLLGVLLAAFRRRRQAVPGRSPDEDAALSEVLPWIEQGNLTASESDMEGQFLRLPLRLEQSLE